MTRKMVEISEKQARGIALQAVGYPEEEQERVFATYEGSTEDKRFRAVSSYEQYDPCDYCWIVETRPLEKRGYEPDGPEFLIWVDQRTGNVVKIGTSQ
jgi:hypothetical protein